MGFLDNSGDIILDAVLTDAGRKRLAEGNGSFRITKYAFGDDEIDYSNYNVSHASGSAYYDLEILQTPVLEAFTNNTATMKSKLVTLTNNNILYLPVIVLNNRSSVVSASPSNASVSPSTHTVTVDQATSKSYNTDTTIKDYGFIDGANPGPAGQSNRSIRCDQGLNTTEIPKTFKIDAELQENQYIIEIDNRFGTIVTGTPEARSGAGTATPGQLVQNYSFIDDDNIASYYLSTDAYRNNTPAQSVTNPDDESDLVQALEGPRGSNLVFRIQASTNLRTSTYLFERLGSTFAYTLSYVNYAAPTTATTFYYIDTIVRVTGATTGYRLDIPVRFVKQQ